MQRRAFAYYHLLCELKFLPSLRLQLHNMKCYLSETRSEQLYIGFWQECFLFELMFLFHNHNVSFWYFCLGRHSYLCQG